MNRKVITLIVFIIILVICSVLYFSLGNKKDEVNKEVESSSKEILNNNLSNSKKDNTKENSDKTLVVYFSRTGETYNVGKVEVGNTAMVASYIKEYLNADSFEILASNPYSEVYKEVLDRATKEKNEDARPGIKDKIDKFDEYDTIFLGYPIWWGEIPMIINTFMESYDFTGKTVIPFNTHEGSGSAGTYSTIKNKLSKSIVKDGLAIQGKVARTDEGKNKTIDFLKSLGY